ncbi:EamA family transporter RarD [Corynebacterium guangdongense]|uniref:Chloramphenicol-sensitive protein RarD n=1 Tax=Corynebacterium guangdongense TaxID=1783348 RepID=A0ABU2A0R4_9CORY|nr:EamA family transporter RarD [Corynebacterium guangdongense]MDR7329718.1 chloramphenicol-sensitive protein RarD [Corynebacterium guangdongense]WJZ18282.1 EamA-like transporter family protein [Corynebacterium guangdongense]
MTAAVLSYLLWGFFPAFFPLLLPAGPLEILAHRIVWTAVFMAVLLIFTGGWRQLVRAGWREWGRLALAGVLISANWGIYVLAVNTNHVADAALAYFINPLLSVVLGMVFFSEKLRRPQLIAVLIATVGVLQLTFLSGQAPIHALGMAVTFGFYGLLKKKVTVTATASVAAETLVVAPFALAYLVWLQGTGDATFGTVSGGHTALMVLSGVVTAAPLLLYGTGVQKLPLATIGMLQYITPTMQMLWALFVTQEQFSTARWIGFIIIWAAVAVYLGDLIRLSGRRRAGEPAEPPRPSGQSREPRRG